MKWLTLDWIKKHSRIDFDVEDDLLEEYGDDAEETVLNIIGRSYEELIETYGEVPRPLFVASLQLVELDYTNRSPNSMQNMYQVGYGFDSKVKPYMRLASTYEQINNKQYGCKNL
jgi:uncharacterized phage protein (predicted DNA packaging)